MLKIGDKATTEGLKEVLSMTKKDLDEERTMTKNLKKEIEKLRSNIDELQVRRTYKFSHLNVVFFKKQIYKNIFLGKNS